MSTHTNFFNQGEQKLEANKDAGKPMSHDKRVTYSRQGNAAIKVIHHDTSFSGECCDGPASKTVRRYTISGDECVTGFEIKCATTYNWEVKGMVSFGDVDDILLNSQLTRAQISELLRRIGVGNSGGKYYPDTRTEENKFLDSLLAKMDEPVRQKFIADISKDLGVNLEMYFPKNQQIKYQTQENLEEKLKQETRHLSLK